MGQAVIAAQLYTVRDFTKTAQELAAALRKVHQMGYQAVEGAGSVAISPAEYKAMLEKEGLVLCGTHTAFERLVSDLPAVIDEHKLWKCNNVGIPSMPGRYRELGEEGFRRFAKEASEIGRKLHDAGLTLYYHNHSFEFQRFGKRTALDVIYEESDPRYLQAQVDTYWVQHGGGDPAAWCAKVKGRMTLVHLKDMVIANGAQAMAEVGEGNLNWPAILQACREGGVRWYVIEQDICQRDPFESLTISYNNLKAMGLS
ncbi:MAG: sugar phosphate isomerase/epimerase family protein [Anaerolineae bacterium]